MNENPDIPLEFNATDPAILKRDLGRFANAMFLFVRTLRAAYHPRMKNQPIVTSGTAQAAFDMVCRVAPIAGQTVTIQLPRAGIGDAGRTLRILRLTATGTTTAVGLDSTINGQDPRTISAARGFVTLMWDGEGWYTEADL